jgi:hypothetical protein
MFHKFLKHYCQYDPHRHREIPRLAPLYKQYMLIRSLITQGKLPKWWPLWMVWSRLFPVDGRFYMLRDWTWFFRGLAKLQWDYWKVCGGEWEERPRFLRDVADYFPAHRWRLFGLEPICVTVPTMHEQGILYEARIVETLFSPIVAEFRALWAELKPKVVYVPAPVPVPTPSPARSVEIRERSVRPIFKVIHHDHWPAHTPPIDTDYQFVRRRAA